MCQNKQIEEYLAPKKRHSHTMPHRFLRILTLTISTIAAMAMSNSNAYAAADDMRYTCPHLGDASRRTISEMTQAKDGWFFRLSGDLREEFDLLPETKNYFKRMVTALEKRGSTLVFMPLPARGVAGRNYLDTDQTMQNEFDEKASAASFSALIDGLRSSGALVVDLIETSRTRYDDDSHFYFRRDHHWTPNGAQHTAKMVTELLKTQPKYTALKPVTYNTKTIGNGALKGSMGTEIQRLCNNKIPAEAYLQARTELVADDAAALFGDVSDTDPSVLLGSSFSAVPIFNFDGFLSQETGLDIANHSISAGLLFNALVSYTSSKQSQSSNPPFIFWEAPGNYDLNEKTEIVFRQIIPAIHGECKIDDAVATSTASIQQGKSAQLFTLKPEQKIAGSKYYLFLESSNRAFNKFTLEIDYDSQDGEWFAVDRSTHFNNEGRFFVELNDEIIGNATSIRIDGMGNLNTNLSARICKKPAEVASATPQAENPAPVATAATAPATEAAKTTEPTNSTPSSTNTNEGL